SDGAVAVRAVLEPVEALEQSVRVDAVLAGEREGGERRLGPRLASRSQRELDGAAPDQETAREPQDASTRASAAHVHDGGDLVALLTGPEAMQSVGHLVDRASRPGLDVGGCLAERFEPEQP